LWRFIHLADARVAHMPVWVGDEAYIVGKAAKSAINIQCPVRKTWHIFKRHAKESDAMMGQRILNWFNGATTAAGASTPVAEPASPANPESGSKRSKDKLSPQSAATSSMLPPPPKRPSTRGGKQVEAATGMQLDEVLGARPAGSSSSMAPPPDSSFIKRLENKRREGKRLQQQQQEGRRLSMDECRVVGELAETERQLALLKNPTPITTPVQTPGSALSGASTQPRAAPTQPAAACAAADYTAAQAAMEQVMVSPPGRAPTRHTPPEVLQRLAKERAERERARQEAREKVRAAEEVTWRLLRAPLDSWDDNVLWQLAMCEFAMEHLGDVSPMQPRQLMQQFRAQCEAARHPSEVPRLRGSQQIDVLQEAIDGSLLLQAELHLQLARYKRLYCSILRGFGRFRVVEPLPGESLLRLMQRTHDDALKWRPPGRPPAEKLAMVSKEKGVYRADWREDTWLNRHEDAGRTLSLRGTVGVTTGGLRRLKNLPEGERPAQEGALLLRGS